MIDLSKLQSVKDITFNWNLRDRNDERGTSVSIIYQLGELNRQIILYHANTLPDDPQEFRDLMITNPDLAIVTNRLDKLPYLYPELARTISGTLINKFCTRETCESRSKRLFPYMIQRRISTVFWALTDTTFSPLRGLDLEFRRRIMQNFSNRILKEPYTTE